MGSSYSPGASQFLSDQGGGLYLARAEEEDRTRKMHTFQRIKEDSRSRPKIPTDIQGTMEKTERHKKVPASKLSSVPDGNFSPPALRPNTLGLFTARTITPSASAQSKLN